MGTGLDRGVGKRSGWASTAWIASIGVLALVMMGLDDPVEVVIRPAGLVAEPTHIRVELAAAERRILAIQVTSAEGGQVLAVETDCRCVAAADPLPQVLPAGTATTVRLAVTGALPGLKVARLRTSAGTVTVQVQIVSEGLGEGADVLATLLKQARAQDCVRVVLLLHDLRGERRNCGCSAGSLGGIDILAGLPAHAATIADGLPVACWFSGSTEAPDSTRANASEDGVVAAALRAAGWQRADSTAVIIAADPATAVQQPGVIAVIPGPDVAMQHQRLVRPLLDRGMTVEALGLDAQQRIRLRQTIPIDRSLPRDATILDRLPAEPLVAVTTTVHPSQDCRLCHQAAHAVWQASAHASACDRLAAGDRTARCLRCHTTTVPEQPAPVAHVQCQACHTGSAAHAAAAGRVRTTGTVSCRTCHDAQHHPGFDPQTAWGKIGHGR